MEVSCVRQHLYKESILAMVREEGGTEKLGELLSIHRKQTAEAAAQHKQEVNLTQHCPSIYSFSHGMPCLRLFPNGSDAHCGEFGGAATKECVVVSVTRSRTSAASGQPQFLRNEVRRMARAHNVILLLHE